MTSTNSNFIKGEELYKNQNFEEAIGYFSLAIKKEENPEIYYRRAMSFFHLKKNKEALTDLETAAELQPQNPFRYSAMAYVRDIMGDTKLAIEDYKKAIKLDPNDAVAFNNLGLLEEKLGWKEKARKNFEKADSLAKDDSWKSVEIEQNEVKNEIAEQNSSEIEGLNKNIFDVIKNLIESKESRSEFIAFLKNGFKLPKKN